MKKIILVMLGCFVLEAAFAQDAAFPEAESEDSLDFVVTAGRTREEAAKVSAQMTVITAEDIAESGATSVTDLLQKVPGISLNRDDTGAGLSVSARGFPSTDGRKKVLILVDGMRFNTLEGKSQVAWDAINLSEIERIEVLDGGASVQYGDNAQAGVINIITKKSGEAKTDITVSGGSFFQNEQRFSHHLPMDWGGFTISGGHRGTQGYQKHSGFDTGNGEMRTVWDINDTMSLQGNVGFAFTNYLFAMSLTKAEFDDDPTQNAQATTDDGSSMNINAGLGWNWAINETLGFDLPFSYIWQSVRYNDPSMIIGMTPHMLNMRPKITAELQPAGMGLRLIGGVDMLLAFNETTASMDLAKGTNPNRQTAQEFSVGPYALVNFEPLSILSLNAGLRYDAAFVSGKAHKWETTMMVDMDQDGSPDPYPVSYPEDEKSANWGSFVYEAGLTANPFNFLKIYAKYGTNFRFPYLDEIMSIDYMAFQYTLKTDIEPEKGWTVEGGVGLNFKGIAKLDGNFYYLRTDNEITSRLSTAAGMTLDYYNADPIERMGTNIGLTLTPVKYMELETNYGFVNAVFSDGPNKDKVVPLVAKHILSASLMAHLPFGLSFGPNVLYKSDFYAFYDEANNLDSIDAYFILGLKARYVMNIRNGGELAFMVTGHNLLDTKYVTLAYGPTVWSGTETTYFIDSNMGRSVNVSLQYRF